ncbi:hypothetical protein M408DRAFT_329782 [Serendipita vermifera MAFF 305830]|uniref:Profilin n=1 Tax=Serendipita vermifera MAFF 305830 TaxID=933852 RepID=A0A0C3ATF5_SERVB|nr:hypothetical protein M408DRAFT_329782 [Serendipita vermifera MAFF 305830]
MSLWGSSPGFNLSAEEQKAIATAFTNIDQLQVNGIKLAGVKYVLIGGGDDQVIQAKKGASGAVLYRTKQAVLVGVYDPPIQQAECNGHIAYHRDYFLSTGF